MLRLEQIFYFIKIGKPTFFIKFTYENFNGQ